MNTVSVIMIYPSDTNYDNLSMISLIITNLLIKFHNDK